MKRLVYALTLVSVWGCSIPLPETSPLPVDLPLASVLKYVKPGTLCSAVAISQELAVTAGHCVGDGFGVLIDPAGGEHEVWAAEAHPQADLALLFTSALDVFSEPALETPSISELIWTAGYGCPRGALLEVRPAQWTGIPAEFVGGWQVAGVVCPGDSGGAAWDSQGRLLGVLSAKHRSSLPIAWITGIDQLAGLL